MGFRMPYKGEVEQLNQPTDCLRTDEEHQDRLIEIEQHADQIELFEMCLNSKKGTAFNLTLWELYYKNYRNVTEK